jgi:hypothetical protein
MMQFCNLVPFDAAYWQIIILLLSALTQKGDEYKRFADFIPHVIA